MHRAAGARFETVSGFEVPADYGDAAAEYAAVRQRAGIRDVSDVGLLEVTGRDRAAFLHAMLSNDVKSLTPGRGCAAALLDVHGKVQVFLTVFALEDRLLVFTPPDMAAKTAESLDTYLFSEKAYFRDATGELFAVEVAGPETPRIIREVAGVEIPEVPWSHVVGSIDGVDVRIVRSTATGEIEVSVIGPSASAGAVWRAIVAAGARPVGRRAFESLRIEAGTPAFGAEADDSVLLPEIPFVDRVSYTKGCYIGQEVVVRIRDRGHVNRLVRGLAIEGDAVPSHGALVTIDGADVGHVTSATWSFGMKRPIALAMIKRQISTAGTRVAVDIDGRAAPTVVSDLPFAR